MPPARRLVLLFLLLLSPAAAEPATWLQAESDLPPDPALQAGTLPNGLRYVIRPNAEPRGRTVLRLIVLAGSLHEEDRERGLAHFVEHMAFNGTRLFPRDSIVSVLRRHGLAFGADVSAFTHPTHTIYGLEVPSADATRLEEGFTVLREFADGQSFDPAEVKAERGVIHSERRARDNWQARAGDALTHFLYPLALHTRRNPIGLEDVISRATADDLRQFYAKWYRADNLLLVVAGDAPPAQIEQLIRDKFASMSVPAAPLPATPDPGWMGNPPEFDAALHSTPETGAVTFFLTSVVAGPGGMETGTQRATVLRRELVLNMLNERFDQLRRARAQEFGDARAFTQATGQVFTQTTLSLTTSTVNWRQATETLALEWQRVNARGFTPAEIAEASERVHRRYEYAVAAAPTEPSVAVAERIASALVVRQVPGDWVQFQAQFEEVMAGFDPAVALATWRELWVPGAPRLYAMGNLAIDEATAEFTKAWRAGLNRPLPPPPRPVITTLDYQPAAKPGAIRKRTHIADLDIHAVEFANGIRLNLKATPFNRNLVWLRARVGQGLISLPPTLPGLNLLANQYVTEAGVGRHFGDDLRRYVTQRNLSLGFGVGEDAFVFTGGSDTRGLPDLLLLLNAHLSDPAWRSADFQTARLRTLLLYSEADREVGAALSAMSARVMSKDNPLFSLPNPNKLGARTFEQLMTWLENSLKAGPVEVGLVGDFEIEHTIEAAARTLGALQPRPVRKPPVKNYNRVFFHGTPGRWQVDVASAIPRAAVRVQWLVKGCSDVHTLRRLETLAEVLEHRVHREIREGMGATYDPSGSVWNGDTLRDDGYLMVHLTAPPADALKLAKRITALAEDLASNGLTADELEAVRQPILSGNDARLRDNNYWLHHVLQGVQEEPMRLEWPRSRERDYRAMTVPELNLLAKKYLPRAAAQTFVAVPRDVVTPKVPAVPVPSPLPPPTPPAAN